MKESSYLICHEAVVAVINNHIVHDVMDVRPTKKETKTITRSSEGQNRKYDC
jgi:hypothetical protein